MKLEDLTEDDLKVIGLLGKTKEDLLQYSEEEIEKEKEHAYYLLNKIREDEAIYMCSIKEIALGNAEFSIKSSEYDDLKFHTELEARLYNSTLDIARILAYIAEQRVQDIEKLMKKRGMKIKGE